VEEEPITGETQVMDETGRLVNKEYRILSKGQWMSGCPEMGEHTIPCSALFPVAI
jgi:hypothetical protein